MLRQTFFNTEKDPREKEISLILFQYEFLATSHPDILRLLIPGKDVWRFFVNKTDIKNGESWYDYELREPGYLQALYKSYHTIFDLKQPLSIEYIKQLHKTANQAVDSRYVTSDQATSAPGLFRNENESIFSIIDPSLAGIKHMVSQPWDTEKQFHLCLWSGSKELLFYITRPLIDLLQKEIPKRKYWSNEKITDFLAKELEYPKRIKLANFQPMLKKIGLAKDNDELATLLYHLPEIYSQEKIKLAFCPFFPNGSPSVIEQYLEKLLSEFLLKQTQKNPLQKLHAIAEFIQACEQLHPFADGNTRVFSMLLLNHLLLRNGFPLAILEDPNRFCSWTIDELVTELIQGMQNTLKLIANKKEDSFKSTPATIPPLQLVYFQKLTEEEEKHHERPAKRPRI